MSIPIYSKQNPSNTGSFHYFLIGTLEFFESLLVIGTSLGDLQDVEADRFTEWPTFTDSDDVSQLHVPTTEKAHLLQIINTTKACQHRDTECNILYSTC